MPIDANSRHRLVRIAPAVLAGMVMAACSAPVVENPTPVSALPQVTAQNGYVINPGDVLNIKFFFNPELNEEELVVRPDGRISLQLIGEQQVAGLTPGQLEQRLQQAYASELRNPQVAVIMDSFAGQRIFVDGQVGTPSEVTLNGRMTALQAIASAGGFTDAARRQVLLIRRGADGQPVVANLDLHAALSGTDLSQDVALEPYDIIFVPRSGVADLNLAIDQYIRQNIPIPFGLGYSIN
ncbi:polysaccharide biosynthesis/export family protein [Telmatospirillum sp. J64-1]|uniref:polysaccharide biosynthesis/export family protein n=1 Tax=Telmatospirillum sp. J64-1 TaxID=2502183 RepID=UPI00115DDCD5|nr:polysaccharide biosynthesis/export family protein [Telmatospirillum sp. J64-1]